MSAAARHPTREALLAEAVGFRPFDDAERAHQLAMIDWLRGSDAIDPFDRNVFDPGHATGSCFVLSSDRRAALIFHANLKLWVQPGGHAESGESDSAVVAAREASEELGVEVDPAGAELFDLDVHRIAPRNGLPSHMHFDFRHMAVIEPVELVPSSDAAEAHWMTRDEIAAIGVDVGVRRMADKAVGLGLLR